MEQITYNMMFRWFVGLSMDAPVWDVTVFTKNRERLLQGDIARGFLAAILIDPHVTVLHESAGGRSSAISFHHYGRQTYSGRPSSSIRFSALTAIATSVARTLIGAQS